MNELELEEMSIDQLIIRIMQGFGNLKDENKKLYLLQLRNQLEEEADALAELLEYWSSKRAKAD